MQLWYFVSGNSIKLLKSGFNCAEYLQIGEFTSHRSTSRLITDYFISDGSDPEWSDDECLWEPNI